MIITLYGSIPSKKNSRQLVRMGRNLMSLPSSAYRTWHKDASKQLMGVSFTRHKLPLSSKAKPVGQIIMTFISGDKRLWDLTNKAESVMDLLVDNGIIEDDNYAVVPTLILQHGGYSKGKPRVEIFIG